MRLKFCSGSFGKLFLLLFLIISVLSIFLSGQSFYPLFKLVFWTGFAVLVSFTAPKIIYGFLAVSGVIEAVLGFIQFASQKSLGLHFFGESSLSHFNSGVAQTFLNPGLLIRAYGTFPHPNILAAFLVLSLISLYYFFMTRSTDLVARVILTSAIFIVWLGLALTFARAGWIIAALASLLFLIFSYNFGFGKKKIIDLAVVITVSIIILFAIFYWATAPRVSELTFDNFTVQERLSDYPEAFKQIKEKPLLGHGLTLSMGENPIHNLYLLMASEIGILGLLAFLGFVASLFFKGLNNWDKRTALLMLVSLLVYGLFDHFLWTLRPGIGALWLVIGISGITRGIIKANSGRR